MIDPTQFAEAFKTATSQLLLPDPTRTANPTFTPIPSVIPNLPVYERAGSAGTKTLWVVFVVMLLSSVTLMVMTYQIPVQKRLFHVITTFITTFATISYFAMATGDGNSYAHIVIEEVHRHVPNTFEHVFRQVFWARYVDWSVTTPLLLLDLSFLAGLNGANILVAVVADILMVLLGLFAAYGRTDGQKWGYYVMSCIAFVVIIYQLIIPGRRAVATKDASTGRLFGAIGGFTVVLWTLYPIVWAIGDGARMWSVDTEILAYAVLDILAKPVFGFWLLFAHGRNVTAIDGFWSRGLGSDGAIRIEDEEN